MSLNLFLYLLAYKVVMPRTKGWQFVSLTSISATPGVRDYSTSYEANYGDRSNAGVPA
jgi:hypothetical protein